MTGSTKRPRLGLVGLGIMGAPIARRLRARGWDLSVWNLEPERYELVSASGARWAASPADLRAQSDVVLLCILGDDAIEAVALGRDGLAAARGAGTVVDLSTTSVEVTRDVARRLGVDWLDCPISGGPQAADDGTLTLMAGGTPALFDRLGPILRDIGANVTLMGPLGAGQTTKVVNQAIVGVNYVLMAEILAMVRAAGIDGDRLAACLAGGAADSTILQRIFPQMLARDFGTPKGRVKQLSKDLAAVADFNRRRGLDLPVVSTAIARYTAHAAAGHGEADSASVALLYDREDGS